MRDIEDLVAKFAKATAAGSPGVQDRLADLPSFGSNPGGLRGRVYIPRDLPAGAALVVVLHGCTQTAAGYDHGAGWSTLADRFRFALLFPEQQRANNPACCFNWFAPEDTRRGGGEVESIRQMIERVVADRGIDRARIFVTGLSAGGGMTSAMLATHPELFAGGAIIAGLPYGAASSVPEAFERMRGQNAPDASALTAAVTSASRHAGPWPTISIWHGSGDTTVDRSNAAAILDQWRSLHGVPAAPDRVETVDTYPRRVWCDTAGREVIEEFIIPGLGHGTPIAAHGTDGCGVAGAFMLEANISSTLHIARFWGLTGEARAAERPARAHPREPAPHLPVLASIRAERIGSSKPRHAAPSGVQEVIEKALRAAGLMK